MDAYARLFRSPKRSIRCFYRLKNVSLSPTLEHSHGPWLVGDSLSLPTNYYYQQLQPLS